VWRARHAQERWGADWGTDGSSLDSRQPICSSLKKLASVVLDFNDHAKASPRIAYDGSGFAVVWHSQPAPVSSFRGDLRFALVDQGSGSSSPREGVTIAADDGATPHRLVAAPNAYTVLHRSPTKLVLRQFDKKGVVHKSVSFAPDYHRVALSSYRDGYALLLADRHSPRLWLIDRDWAPSKGSHLITAQVMASLWLAPYKGGLAAALHSTNQNATLYLLDESGMSIRKQAAVGGGLLLRSPRFLVLPAGFAAVYGSLNSDIETQTYDLSGTSLARTSLAKSGRMVREVDDIAAVWTGRQLIVVHPASNGYEVSFVAPSGKPTGYSTQLPKCLATADGVSAAWGNGQLAVASLTSGSGVPYTGVCVMVMACE
jgi:hypothetical protein